MTNRLGSLKRVGFGLAPVQALSVAEQLIEESFHTATFQIGLTALGSVAVFLNGLLQRRNQDYTMDGDTFTILDFVDGDHISVLYLATN